MFTSTSTAIFRTFPCDNKAVDGKKFLRADYRVLCDTPKHTIYKIYAGLMMLVSACVRFLCGYDLRRERSMPFSLAWSVLACLHDAQKKHGTLGENEQQA